MQTGILTCLAVFLMGSFCARGQHLGDWLAASGAGQQEIISVSHEVDVFVQGLREPGPGTQRHLSKVFRKVHGAYLKKYEAYASFQSLVENGQYDCLTATMLLSHVLTDLQYEFNLVETNYHIFILVQTADGQVLLESTDRVSGLITDTKAIAERTAAYRTIVPPVSDTTRVGYRFQCQLYQAVSCEDLTGLLYFNQAVKAYNSGDWLGSARFLEEGFQRYPTDRCLELGDILVRTLVVRKDVSQELRRASMEHLMPLILRRSGKVAVNVVD